MKSKKTKSLSSKRSNKGLMAAMILLIIVATSLIAAVLLLEREHPRISMLTDLDQIGATGKIKLAFTDQRSGLRRIDARLVQGNKSAPLFSKAFPRQGYFSKSGPNQFSETMALDMTRLGFDDGAAELIVVVLDYSGWNWMAGNRTVMTYPVTLDTTPPKIRVIESTRYINGGGSGIVTYRINEPVAHHGVMLNNHYHPGFPLSEESDDLFIAYIALPYDTEAIEQSLVRAVDPAGNVGEAGFSPIFKKGKFNQDRINVSDGFLNRKIPEFRQEYDLSNGSLVEQYLVVNNRVRQQNNEQIAAICKNPSAKQLWQGRFTRMAGSSRAQFADYRTYYYQGREIDQQVHLGMDIASTRHAQIKAANHGIAVFTDYLGIYGNTVILDHGQGVFSLYSHLSSITVATGDRVAKGTPVGISGATGMAGGDHLHFSMLINGIFVNPLEWWDARWIENHITSLLPESVTAS